MACLAGACGLLAAGPLPQAAAAVTPWDALYTVQAGDSLSEIARHYGVSFVELARVNGLDWRKPLLVGAVLHVPPLRSSGPDWSGTYVVQPGDTLSGIALHYGVSLSALVSANAIDPAKPLWVGVRLRVPGLDAMAELDSISETDVYGHGSLGYDVSYPNCAAASPGPGAFSVVGLNGGRPFTANPCFAGEWAASQAPRSVYINSAYSPIMFDQITPACLADGRTQPLAPAAQRAYALGCAEAAAALRLLAAGGLDPAGIWVDVERANTWSSRRDLNLATIEGMLEELLVEDPHAAVGIYSTIDSWHRIVGADSRLAVPEWVGTAPGSAVCPAGFAAGPVWLSQTPELTLDLDTAC